MPAFDLRYIRISEAELVSGHILYQAGISLGDAMTVNMELRFAEAKAWAESSISAALRWVISGTVSIGVDQFNRSTSELIQDMFSTARQLTPGELVREYGVRMHKSNNSTDHANVGLAFYAPDMVDGAEKFCCVFAPWVRLSPPTQGYQTLGENVTFSTPTLTGEIRPAPVAGHPLFETGLCDTEAQARQWVDTVLTGTYS